mmetsp:Transcript_10899/g.23990  ORF Transcript_10899/g.23990 Transcript_10899/m.23990 type:complete len:222 (+) Transcript_10899:2001-2666(+)
MTQDDRLELLLGSIAILPRQHVDLSLIHSQLTNVRLQKEDVRTLHERIQDLGGSQVSLHPPHNLTTLFNPRHIKPPCHIQHQRPIHIRLLRNLRRSPTKLHILQIHPRRLPNFDQVFSHNTNLGKVSTHFVIHEGEPIGYPETEGGVSSGGGAFVDVDGFEEALGDVHSARWFEAVVEADSGGNIHPAIIVKALRAPSLGQNQPPQLLLRNAFLSHAQYAG